MRRIPEPNTPEAGIRRRREGGRGRSRQARYPVGAGPRASSTELEPERAIIAAGDIVVDRTAHRVWRGGRAIHLPPQELRLLCYCMQHRGQAFTREQLLERLWRPNVTSNPRVVDTCIARIRRALAARGERDPFRTIANVGYAFERA